MMVNPIGFSTYTYPVAGAYSPSQSVGAVNRVNGVTPVGYKSTNTLEKVKPSECQTCKSRKYMDGSNDSNVSFKSPTHVSPAASFSAVAAHEQQHVSNAIRKGNSPDAELASVSVSLKMAVCPECGTPYVAGGETRSVIKYNESNPYEKERKSLEGSLLKGMNFNQVA